MKKGENMKRNILVLIMAGIMSLALAGTANADDKGPPFSYQAHNPDHEMMESVSGLIEWAKGELLEHQNEGLFKDRMQDEQLIQDMIAFAKKLQGQGAAAKKAGDMRKARMYYNAAEATAQYAAFMPHMLEDRVRKHK